MADKIRNNIIHLYNTTSSKHIIRLLKKENLWDHVYTETKNLNNEISDSERLFNFIFGTDPNPCINGKNKKFSCFSVGYTFCGSAGKCECAKQSMAQKVSETKLSWNKDKKQEVLNKRISTVLNRYGETNVFKTSEVKKKTKNTIIEKYGVDNIRQVALINDKIKQTNLERYGVENPLLNEQILENIKQTNLERYGVENPLQNVNIQNKARETLLEKYGITNPMHCNIIKQKGINTLISRYQVHNPTYIGKDIESIEILLNKDKFTQLVSNHTRYEIMSQLGISSTCFYSKIKEYNITLNPNSLEEQTVFNYIKSIYPYGEIIRNTRKIISPYELDIFLPELNIAIEYCGLYWHSEKTSLREKRYHYNKFFQCKEKGIDLITIFSDEWLLKTEIVKSRLAERITQSKSIFARNCEVKEITAKECNEFLQKHHIQGSTRSKFRYGLIHDTELKSVMTFGQPRFNKSAEIELIRFCSAGRVVGGASKLFKKFINDHAPMNIICYSDNRWGRGAVYKNLGFVKQSEIQVGYFYTDYENRYNRIMFQKHKLIKEGFDPNKTEWEIMQERGYDRIWDCGQTVWRWENIK